MSTANQAQDTIELRDTRVAFIPAELPGEGTIELPSEGTIELRDTRALMIPSEDEPTLIHGLRMITASDGSVQVPARVWRGIMGKVATIGRLTEEIKALMGKAEPTESERDSSK